tara:strand:+ start:15491 stop:16288 length:798 start_codon:yes stop_codon:yes gene_type:complete
MTGSILSFAAIAAYTFGMVYHLMQLRRDPHFNPASLQAITAIGIGLHTLAIARLMLVDGGLDLSLLKIIALLALVTNTLVFVSGLKKPLHSLYLLLMPVSVLCLLAAVTSTSSKPPTMMSTPIQGHVLISILAYSLLAIAALQALLAGYQDWQLKHKHQNILMRTLPPVQTMETLLFELIWAGEILLTLSLVSGFMFFDDLFAQHLVHKVTFSLVAWAVYATLLWGRHSRGWRGNKAIRWTWGGFAAIAVGYIGSKIVLEFILVQ